MRIDAYVAMGLWHPSSDCDAAPIDANIRSLSIKGSPYTHFRRALEQGNLELVRLAATELPQVNLDDALRICLLMSDQRDARYERAAVRWLGRVCLERPDFSLADLELASSALSALPTHRLSALHTLSHLCSRLHLSDLSHLLHP